MGLDHAIIGKIVKNKLWGYEDLGCPYEKEIRHNIVSEYKLLTMRKEYFIDSWFERYFNGNDDLLGNCNEKWFDVEILSDLIRDIKDSTKADWEWARTEEDAEETKKYYIGYLEWIIDFYKEQEKDNFIDLYYWRWY